MPSVFSDLSGNGRHLTITTSADWTIHSADLPNGDNSASVSTALNENAHWIGEEFCIPTGAGTEALTVEFWVNVTAGAAGRSVCMVRTDATTIVDPARHYSILLTSGEAIDAAWFATSGGTPHLQATTGSLTAGWHHVVVIFRGGSSHEIEIFVDDASAATDTSTTGTGTTASSDTYRLYVGGNRTDATGDMTDHMAKLAIYDRELDSTEISEHYTAMLT